MQKRTHGFTLIELLVVISIISLLASIIFAATNQSRQKAKIAKAKRDVQQLRFAAEVMVDDMGKYPGGCPPDRYNDMEMWLMLDSRVMDLRML